MRKLFFSDENRRLELEIDEGLDGAALYLNDDINDEGHHDGAGNHTDTTEEMGQSGFNGCGEQMDCIA